MIEEAIAPRTKHIVLDPTIEAQPTSPLAPRLRTLRGARIGVLWNGRVTTGPLLRRVVELANQRNGFGEVVFRKKPFLGNLAPDEILTEIASCDAAIVGVGDCGSCTSGSVLDAVALERRGIPVAMFGVDQLVRSSGRGTAVVQGFANLPLLEISDPEGLSVEGYGAVSIERIALDLVPRIEETLTAPVAD